MTQTNKTWSLVGLAVLALILVALLLRRKAKMTATQTSVNISGVGVSQFPTRNNMNEALLRICSYDNNRQLSLDPGAAGGRCAPIFTSVDGSTKYLVRDEIIVIPQAGGGGD